VLIIFGWREKYIGFMDAEQTNFRNFCVQIHKSIICHMKMVLINLSQ